MLPKLQYHLTNWIDGMKISRHHFSNSESAVLDLLRDVSAIVVSANSYGLLSPEPGEKNAIECEVLSSQSKKFKISVKLCRAITIGGCRIEIIPGVDPELVRSAGWSVDETASSAEQAYKGVSAPISHRTVPILCTFGSRCLMYLDVSLLRNAVAYGTWHHLVWPRFNGRIRNRPYIFAAALRIDDTVSSSNDSAGSASTPIIQPL